MIFVFVFLEGRGGLGRIGGECSGMVDGFVMSDLVYYQLCDRGCAPLLVLFFIRDTSFENLLGAL